MTPRMLFVPALCALLFCAACSKSQDTSTTSTTSVQNTAATSPAADATAAAESAAAVGSNGSSGANAGGPAFIDVPIYAGATEAKEQALTSSSNGTSVVMHVYTVKTDAKIVADWYVAHLPHAWKNAVLTAGGKTIGTFSNESANGDQSVIVGGQDDGLTRIQITTKHGK